MTRKEFLKAKAELLRSFSVRLNTPLVPGEFWSDIIDRCHAERKAAGVRDPLRRAIIITNELVSPPPEFHWLYPLWKLTGRVPETSSVQPYLMY